MTPQLRFRSYPQVKEQAAEFLRKYNADGTIPVHIERIIDQDLDLHIAPFPNLYRDHHTHGYLSLDRSTIWVDETQQSDYPRIYRFTLAHEVGHYILHADYLKDIRITSLSEYKSWLLSESPHVVGWMDTHAGWFAGLVLVPCEELTKVCRQILERSAKFIRDQSIDPNDFWEYASIEMADYFDVNPIVVEKCIKKENISSRVRRK